MTNAISQVSYIQYDDYLGKPVNSEDANSNHIDPDGLEELILRLLCAQFAGAPVLAIRLVLKPLAVERVSKLCVECVIGRF